MNKDGTARYHSVILDEEACKGCTVCVTTCPAEAIRVRDGKARITAERCIDCGECIRRCPHHAKKARADDFSLFAAQTREVDPSVDTHAFFRYRIALPAPSLYGQFPEKYSISDIHNALLSIGFDRVFPVAAATPAIVATTSRILKHELFPEIPRPIISSSCPTIIKFIQIRFPTLIDNIEPVIAPMELAGRMARLRFKESLNAAQGKTDTVPDSDIGCFFITPCPGKITEAVEPLGGEQSSISGVYAMQDIQIPLLHALGERSSRPDHTPQLSGAEISWGRAGGEGEATTAGNGFSCLAADSIEQCTGILEAVEDGSLTGIDFLELMACPGGCAGGPLAAKTSALSRHVLKHREKPSEKPSTKMSAEFFPESFEDCLRKTKIPARPALLLDADFKKAVQMMDTMETISADLPGLDCGCCGAPNCRALAEDIVRGSAEKTDCVIILKEQYRELLEK